MPEPVLRLRNLSKYRTGGGVSFHLVVPEMDIAPGERVALVGESGCGKSTLLDLLAMVLRVDEADVFFLTPPQQQTFNVLTLWRRRRLDALAALRGRYLGYVLQTGGLLGFMTVRDNINLTRRLLDLADDGTVEQLAERLDLTRYLGRYPAALSVGERQRVAIARALAHRPPIVIADEPTASLDPITADSVMDLFVELVQEQGATTIISSHDWARVERYGLSPIRAFLERDEQATGTVTATFRRVEAWA